MRWNFLRMKKKLLQKLKPLSSVGLGYVKLGQSSDTLSGGEAQRVKLASFLGKGKSLGHILFIFDEPTTGLHFHDIKKLLTSFSALIDQGHSVLVVEHNTDVIRSADWVIDLGPEAGDAGGNLVYEGIPVGIEESEGEFHGEISLKYGSMGVGECGSEVALFSHSHTPTLSKPVQAFYQLLVLINSAGSQEKEYRDHKHKDGR